LTPQSLPVESPEQQTVTHAVVPLMLAVAVLVAPVPLPLPVTVPDMLVVPLSHIPDHTWNMSCGIAVSVTVLVFAGRHTVEPVTAVPSSVTVHQSKMLLMVSTVPAHVPVPEPVPLDAPVPEPEPDALPDPVPPSVLEPLPVPPSVPVVPVPELEPVVPVPELDPTTPVPEPELG
jgi:hypothetical protein